MYWGCHLVNQDCQDGTVPAEVIILLILWNSGKSLHHLQWRCHFMIRKWIQSQCPIRKSTESQFAWNESTAIWSVRGALGIQLRSHFILTLYVNVIVFGSFSVNRNSLIMSLRNCMVIWCQRTLSIYITTKERMEGVTPRWQSIRTWIEHIKGWILRNMTVHKLRWLHWW